MDFNNGAVEDQTGFLATLYNNPAMTSEPDRFRPDTTNPTTASFPFGNTIPTTADLFTTTRSDSTSFPTTLATTTSPQGTAETVGRTAHADHTGVSTHHAQAQSNQESGLSNGEIAAATILPVLATLLIIMAFLLLLRRRSKAKRTAPPPPTTNAGKTSFFGVDLKEKWTSVRSSSSSSSSTSSTSSTKPTTTDPPTSPQSDNNDHHHPSTLPQTTDLPTPLPPPYHIFPPTSSSSPLQSSARSARSINSDVYSDTASIHSARAARVSIGGPAMIHPANGGGRIGRSSGGGEAVEDAVVSVPVPALPAMGEGRRGGG